MKIVNWALTFYLTQYIQMYFPVSYSLKSLCTLQWHIKFSEGQQATLKSYSTGRSGLPSFTSHSHTLKAQRTAVLGLKGVCYPLSLAWHNSGYSRKAHQKERQEVQPKVGCTYLMALLGVHSGGRSPGQELRTYLLGGADPCNTASSQESAENVFSL